MITGWYQSGTGASDWYYANADGTLYDGWLYYGKDWYYINDGRMQTGWITSKGKNIILELTEDLYPAGIIIALNAKDI